MMTDELRHKIEAYLYGKLPKNEAEELERRLATDPEFNEEFKTIKATNNFLLDEPIAAISKDTELTNELRDFYKSNEAEVLRSQIKEIHESRTLNRQKPYSAYYFLVAAVVTIAIISAIVLFKPSSATPQELYVEYYSENDLPSVVQRGDIESQFQEAVIAFQEQNYEKSEMLMDIYLTKVNEPKTNVLLYKGLIDLSLNKFDDALDSFQLVAKSNSLDKSKGLWFIALTHLKKNQKGDAKSTLNKILEDESNFNYLKAKRLLKEL